MRSLSWLALACCLFTRGFYTDGNERFPAVNKQLEHFALRSHYQKKPLEVILDNKRRPIFELFGFRRTEPQELSGSVRGGGSR